MASPFPTPVAIPSQPNTTPSTPTATTPAPKARNRGGTGTAAKRPRKGKAKAGTPAPDTPVTQSPVVSSTQPQWMDAPTSASQIADALGQADDEPGSSTGLHGLVLPSGTGVDSLMPPPPKPPAGEEEGEGDDEALPAMAEDDYSAQLSWQSQSKDNLKYVVTLP